ncbi:MAG: Glutathione synthase/Ribosomal protein S6 modification enzyme (glutaminyl transferase) [Rhodobacteraceae bacterium]|uniref:ATP-grasp domain-containing protein n=1 Tax=Cypionkella sp. TaxID=2811411 RepID=UPI001325C4A0|nr:hypothetical protein [Cypionkella sp.]KAF0174739.1 MAG: Glutathione synthase/Ribosomal protein S6 modification enzyme (glutaminyl transferase) [Paracoccaceae bacterium]MDO8327430.1 hypothetical protein [Cypionkella sp.]
MQLSSSLYGPPVPAWPDAVPTCLGPSAIVRLAYAGADRADLTRSLVARLQGPLIDPAAQLDLATLLMAQGGDLALEGRILQQNAVRMQRSYQICHGRGTGLRILAFVTPGDFMANTPLDFLLEGSDAVLILHFVDATTQRLDDLPPHDVAFMAIGESPENARTLLVLAGLLAGWRRPIFNNAAALIASLTRDRVSQLLADEASLYAPPTHQLTRDDLAQVLSGLPLSALGQGLRFPLILRPTGSHAGAGMQRITGLPDLAHWLAHSAAASVYVAPFIDYRGADGLYTKQRIVLIKGRAFASHQASSKHWMVHYLNADMAENPARRDAEAAWMQRFDQDFARRHATAFAALYRLVGLDYFGIDCAELPDGRLLVFELDVAMIVHNMDDPAIFPYKQPAMRKLFGGFLAALEAAAQIEAVAVGQKHS